MSLLSLSPFNIGTYISGFILFLFLYGLGQKIFVEVMDSLEMEIDENKQKYWIFILVYIIFVFIYHVIPSYIVLKITTLFRQIKTFIVNTRDQNIVKNRKKNNS